MKHLRLLRNAGFYINKLLLNSCCTALIYRAYSDIVKFEYPSKQTKFIFQEACLIQAYIEIATSCWFYVRYVLFFREVVYISYLLLKLIEKNLHNILLNHDLLNKHLANIFLSDERIKILVLLALVTKQINIGAAGGSKKTNLCPLIFTLQLCLHLDLSEPYPNQMLEATASTQRPTCSRQRHREKV